MCPDVSCTEADVTVSCAYAWMNNFYASDDNRGPAGMTVACS